MQICFHSNSIIFIYFIYLYQPLLDTQFEQHKLICQIFSGKIAPLILFYNISSMLQSNLQTQTKNILNNNQFNSIRRLGKGGFAHVLLATKATSSSTYYAIKCISKKKMIKDPQLKRFLLQQINTMAMLDHINIVKLLKTLQQGQWYFLVMEYCDMGNLHNYQNKQTNKVFSMEEAVFIYLQILQGLQYIHQNNIIHRDIKLQNIFIKKNTKNNNYICKIGDFGLARPIDNQQTAITNCGTEIYMAPEILSGQSYGKQADIWSLGVLFYHLLFGDFPFKGMNILDQIKGRCKSGYKLSQHLKNKNYFKSKRQEHLLSDLFQRLFEMNPSKRIGIRQLRNHQIFKKETEMIEQLTTNDQQQDEKIIEWQISRIQFIQRIVQSVNSYNILSFYLSTAFKFYINKVLLYFISRETIQNYKHFQYSNPKILAQIADIELKIKDQIYIQYNLLVKNQHLKQPIDKFEDGFNLQAEDFVTFKMAYRNTVGRVYEEAHKKIAENIQERTILKLKLFLCHIINRVFSGNVNAAIFPFYLAWVKKNNIKISQRFYDFKSLQQWIKQQKAQNLQRSQDTINQMFYK